MDKNIKDRSRVLRNALDNGVLDLKELRSFLAMVEDYSPPAKRRDSRIERRQRQLEKLSKSIR